jgi:hypothetical protein
MVIVTSSVDGQRVSLDRQIGRNLIVVFIGRSSSLMARARADNPLFPTHDPGLQSVTT